MIAVDVAAQPSQYAAIRAQLLAMQAQGDGEAVVDSALAIVRQLIDHNTQLMLDVHRLKQQMVRPKRESVDPGQLALALEAAEGLSEAEQAALVDAADHAAAQTDAALEALAQADAETPKAKRKPRRRTTFSDALARQAPEALTLPPSARVCPGCQTPMTDIGTDTRQVLTLTPALFEVRQVARTSYGCKRCKGAAVVAAPLPTDIPERCMADTTVLAHLIQAKYAQHLPLYRLERIYEAMGVTVSRRTLCDWVALVANLLAPVAEAIRTQIVACGYARTDATGLRVLDSDKPGGAYFGTVWCHIGQRHWVHFDFAEDGRGETGPWAYYAGYAGYLQADAHTVFDRIFRSGKVIEVGCLAHGRRKFFQLLDTDPRAAVPIDLIRKVYRVETLADKRQCTVAERLTLRRQRSVPLMQRLNAWVTQTYALEPPKSALAKAAAYLINHWDALTRFLSDGQLDPDNNLTERQIKAIAIGRKNYLFAGSVGGAQNAAVCYSLLRTCALMGIDPYRYLVWVLNQRLAHPDATDMRALLPDRFPKA